MLEPKLNIPAQNPSTKPPIDVKTQNIETEGAKRTPPTTPKDITQEAGTSASIKPPLSEASVSKLNAITTTFSSAKEILNALSEHGATIQETKREGIVNVFHAGLCSEIDLNSPETAKETLEAFRGLLPASHGGNENQMVLGFCVGNKIHGKEGVLEHTLRSIEPLVGAERFTKDVSVHSVADQAQCNTDVVSQVFGRLAPNTLSEMLIQKEATLRQKDADSFRAQTDSMNIKLDHIIHSTDGPEKNDHVRGFNEGMRGLIAKAKDDPGCANLRETLTERISLLRDLANAQIANKSAGKARDALAKNEATLVSQFKEFCGDDPDAARRAELVIHSIDVLEQIALGAMEAPKGKGKIPTAERRQILEAKIPEPDNPQNVLHNGFYSTLIECVADERSLTYMGAQEFEFETFSKDRAMTYIYPSSPGPFLTANAEKTVSTLTAFPSPPSGSHLRSTLDQLG